MRILVFCPYYPPHIGGLETHSDEFNKHLAHNGADVTVFTPNIPHTANTEEIKYDRVKIVRYPAFDIIPNYPVPKFWSLGFWKSFISLFHDDFDIVISRTRFFLSSLLALIYAKRTKTRWIHIEHGSDFVQLSSPVKSAIAKAYDYTFGKIIFRSSDLTISISKAVQTFVRKFDKRESPVIYRGIDFASIDAVTPDETIRQTYYGKIIISTVARLYKWKGIAHTIEAIRNAPEAIQSKIVFLIIGDGEDFKHLKSLTQGLPIVEMLGNLPREKVFAILKTSDIYVHSSLPGGGLSTSLLEAMYTECAIIATPNEGADEIIVNQKNGLIIPAASPEKTRQAIIDLINNDVRNSLGKNAKKTVQEKFLWEESIRHYLKYIQ